jgi:LmbE family N-acetylglucosaminyl deacetylase
MPQPENSGRSILGVFAHPDDETAGVGGTIARYTAEGATVRIVTATRGEQGSLGPDGRVILREDLPIVRETELRSALIVLGAPPPVLLGYRDGEVADADFDGLVAKVEAQMDEDKPDVVIAFGPTGITGHSDHITVHRATVEAFHRYTRKVGEGARLLYFAITPEIAQEFDLEIAGPEAEPNVEIDISDVLTLKLKALRIHGSQMDIQEMTDKMEDGMKWDTEMFHQAIPPVPEGEVSKGLWP